MTEQPEALRLADALDAGENFYAESSLWFDHKLADDAGEAAAELRRLHEENELNKALVLEAQGMAIQLSGANQELLEALKLADESVASFVSDHGWAQRDMDILDTISAAIAKHGGAA